MIASKSPILLSFCEIPVRVWRIWLFGRLNGIDNPGPTNGHNARPRAPAAATDARSLDFWINTYACAMQGRQFHARRFRLVSRHQANIS